MHAEKIDARTADASPADATRSDSAMVGDNLQKRHG